MKEIVKVMQDVLNSPEIQNRYGKIFAMLSEDDKVKFQVWLIYRLAETDENIRNILAKHAYETLRRK